ncbi:alpha/beta fold hydrolase [Nocardia ignorata]|uniref:Pimeloyl-ACP methyl ester carboxylesterase n=1 Tax=Nocardia ignorata TaxID=145285 RepID=A0A4R6P209_NOCIG|nr:alpha/beta fold hydrolase [Nocardia ignorata]TDP31521.1 pimeloyl-ACP methyl ester carboxylesterase [Nocardia ignorata]
MLSWTSQRSADAPVFLGGDGEPVVLLHGATMSWRVWEPLLPSLVERHRVLAPNLLAHIGNPALTVVVTLDDLVDAVEVEMDRAGFGTAHIAGNSLGGLVAMELARRGRARSVFAISPAGGWTPADGEAISRKVANQQWLTRRVHRLIPFMMRFEWARRQAFRDVALRADKLSPAAAVTSLQATAAATIFERITGVVVARSYGELGAPVLIAWPEEDLIIPLRPHGMGWRALVPDARWVEIGGVGHVPMIDEPDLVKRLLTDWIDDLQ